MNDMATADAVVRGEHLTALHDHLDHMLVAHILSRKKRIAVEYEDVHEGTILPNKPMSSYLIKIQLHPMLQVHHKVP